MADRFIRLSSTVSRLLLSFFRLLICTGEWTEMPGEFVVERTGLDDPPCLIDIWFRFKFIAEDLCVVATPCRLTIEFCWDKDGGAMFKPLAPLLRLLWPARGAPLRLTILPGIRF